MHNHVPGSERVVLGIRLISFLNRFDMTEVSKRFLSASLVFRGRLFQALYSSSCVHIESPTYKRRMSVILVQFLDNFLKEKEKEEKKEGGGKVTLWHGKNIQSAPIFFIRSSLYD